MKLTVVFLLAALASCSCSPSPVCDTLRKFVLSALHDPLDQYLEFIEPYVGSSPSVKTAATQLKLCAEDHSEELKEAKVELMTLLEGSVEQLHAGPISRYNVDEVTSAALTELKKCIDELSPEHLKALINLLSIILKLLAVQNDTNRQTKVRKYGKANDLEERYSEKNTYFL
ncbi:UNVERIFIED_CONTAM: hypothetical protein H355_002065 [Colinus virginianus]|nr:hypothetical protein H355_002065 [Colinus virginianus]